MNKFLFFLLFLVISLGYIFEVDKMVARTFNPFESLKNSYIDMTTSIKEKSEKYFQQVTTIEELQKENKELKNYKLLYETAKNELDSTLKTINAQHLEKYKIQFVEVLSYINFDDYTKVWLDYEKKDNTILGLISGDFAAGIVVKQDNRAKALLNGNPKSNYAVFIGENKAPGLIHAAKNGRDLIAKFIPIWFDIKEGDEVITSGMDNIFFEGLKVGKVVSIKKMQDIQEATIVPYAKVLKQRAFFVYKQEKKKEIPAMKKEETKEPSKEKKPIK